MTNSGKWAHYAPASIGVEVALGSLKDGVESAVVGKVVHMSHGRGSSSSSSVLAEAMRIGTVPTGLVLGVPDSILVIRLSRRQAPL